MEQGLAKGLAKGLVEGLAEGEKKGEEKATYKIAIALKAAGVPYQTISETTGLTNEEIEKL